MGKLLKALQRSRRAQLYDGLDRRDVTGQREIEGSMFGRGYDSLASGAVEYGAENLDKLEGVDPLLAQQLRDLGPITSTDMGYMGNAGVRQLADATAQYSGETINSINKFNAGQKYQGGHQGVAQEVWDTRTRDMALQKLTQVRSQIKDALDPRNSSYGQRMRQQAFGSFDFM